MTTLLNTLPANIQSEVMETLTAFDKCNVDFYNGKYHVHIGCGIQDEYPVDFRFICVVKNSDVYTPDQIKQNIKNL